MNFVGIDIGASKIVIHKMNQAGPEVILSPSSSRSFPNVISFSKNERHICSEIATS